VFARYDDSKYQTNTLVAGTEAKEKFYDLGIACKPRKGVDLALVYKHDDVKIGGLKASDRDEVGVWAQVAF
jgi:hypothetical protein